MLKLLLILTVCHMACGAYPLADFYDFGASAGDSLANGASVNLSIELPFFQHRERTLFATSWGVLSFQRPIFDHTQCGAMDSQSRMIAVYWTHVDLSYGGSFSYRQDTNPKNLNKAAAEIRAAFPNLWGVDVKWLFIATWYNVTYYFAAECTQPYPRNTYQAIIASNGVTSFSIFKYNSIVWTTGTASCTLGNNCTGLAGNKGTAAKVGFDAGDGKNLLSAPNSCTDQIANVDKDSNVGVPGMFIYRIDSSTDDLFANCDKSGKYNDGKEKLLVFPSFVEYTGGMPIYLQGPCFERNSTATCVFHDPVFGLRKVAGSVELINENKPTVVCIAPFMQESTRINVDVVVTDAVSGNTSYYSAYLTTTYPTPTVNTTFMYGFSQSQQNPIVELIEFTWLSENFNSSLNVSLLYHDPADELWKYGGVIERNVKNTGQLIISPGQLSPDLLNKLRNESISTISFTFESTYTDILSQTVRRSASDGAVDWTVDLGLQPGAPIAIARTAHSPAVALFGTYQTANDYCNNWYQQDPGVPVNSLPPCPRLLEQALVDPNFERDGCIGWCLSFFHPGATDSFRSTAANSVGAGQQCTYNSADGGKLLIGPPGGGTADMVSPNSKLKRETGHFSADVVPWFLCCQFSDNCDKYYEKRPSNDGTQYVPPRPGQGTGDPHIVTFDSLQYTFNGAGEFWFIKTNDASPFQMQCRMEAVTSSSSSSATVYTAFVMRDGLGPIVQVQLSQSSVVNEVLVDGYPLWFTDPALYSQCFPGVCVKTLSANVSTVIVSFDSGFTFILRSAQGAMTVTATAPNSKKGLLSGLLGNFDGIPDNDHMLPNGTVIAPTSLFDIHWSFGMNWLATQNESLFTYATGKSYSYYYNPLFTPTFDVPALSSLPPEEAAKVEKACGTSTDCVFDYFATGGDLAFAEQTAAIETQFNNTLETLEQVVVMCPSISSPQNGTFNSTSSFYNGTQVHFECKPGFIMHGASTTTCVNGVWSNEPPTCNIPEPTPESTTTTTTVPGGSAAANQAIISVVVVSIITAAFCALGH